MTAAASPVAVGRLRKRTVLRAAVFLVVAVFTFAMGVYVLVDWPGFADKFNGLFLVVISPALVGWAVKYWKMRRVAEDMPHA